MNEPPPLPKRPYRDSIVVNLVLAGLILLISWLTDGDVGRALLFALGFFVIATAWAWLRFRQRLNREGR